MSQSCADARPHLRRGSSWEIGSLGFALLKPEQVPLGISIAIEPAAGHLKRVDLMHTVEGHVRFHGDIIVNPQNPNISDVDAVFGRRMARSARLRRCMSGGTSWNVAFHVKVMASLYAELASLSRIWRSTERPRAAR